MSDLPPFSPVFNRLLASLANEDTPLGEIAGIIEKDAVIAGNVLKLVNSAMYGRRDSVTSIRHASSLLGINRLRNAVLGLSLARMWNNVKTPQEWSNARFNLHSVGVAILADLLAQRTRVEFPEGAFLAGLFHDLGKLLIAIGLKQEYSEVIAEYELGTKRYTECEQELLGFSHAALSGAAVALWRIPEPVQQAVVNHHSAHEFSGSVPFGMCSLAEVLHCADAYLHSTGTSVERKRSAMDAIPAEPFASLGIVEDVKELIEEFEAEYEALTLFFR
jgi:HD-like signal output (HDOD) protein